MPDPIQPTRIMPRGAIPTPPAVLAAAKRYVPPAEPLPPLPFLAWPSQFSSWGNDTDGDCVSAEEAFAKVLAAPYICISDDAVKDWANHHGFDKGTSPEAVLKAMHADGLPFAGGTLYDGPYSYVEYKDPPTLQSAIRTGLSVKLGVAAAEFQSVNIVFGKFGYVTPGVSGWTMCGYPANLPQNHCVGLCGYGLLSELIVLFAACGVVVQPLPNMPRGMCYAFFTWDSIGIVDEQSLVNMTSEAWARDPLTIIDYPLASAFELDNEGGFVCDIHALYRNPGVPSYSEANNGDNFSLGQTRTMSLGDKCPNISNGDVVQLKVWVEGGKDCTYDGLFLYGSKGPTRSFKITGTTLNNSIQYLRNS